MRSSKISLSTFLACFALLAPRVSCQTEYDDCQKTALFAALVSSNLTDYADLVCNYAPEITKQENTLVYAPNNPAVQAYLAGNPQPGGGGKFIRDMIFRRSVPDPNANAAAKGNTGTASNSNNNFGSLPPRGAIGGSGTASAKVSKPAAGGGGRKRQSMPPLGYVGSITAGGGGTSFVLEDARPYGANSYYYEIDSFTTASQGVQNTLGTDPRLMPMAQIFDRVPYLRELAFTSYNHTLFVPTEEALKAANLNSATTPVEILEQFIKDHMILNSCSFIGYTPSFVDGGSFQVYSGKYVSSRFEGLKTILNSCSLIVGEDLITGAGTVQLIDKPLFTYYTPY